MNARLLQLPTDDEEMDQEEADEAALHLGEPQRNPRREEKYLRWISLKEKCFHWERLPCRKLKGWQRTQYITT